MERTELSLRYDARPSLKCFESCSLLVLKIGLVQEMKMSRTKYMNREQLSRAALTGVAISCVLPIAASHADPVSASALVTTTRNLLTRPTSSSVSAFTMSDRVAAPIVFASALGDNINDIRVGFLTGYVSHLEDHDR
jgi:hypothetical protein